MGEEDDRERKGEVKCMLGTLRRVQCKLAVQPKQPITRQLNVGVRDILVDISWRLSQADLMHCRRHCFSRLLKNIYGKRTGLGHEPASLGEWGDGNV